MRPIFQIMLPACLLFVLIGCTEQTFVAEDYLYLDGGEVVLVEC